MDGLPEHRSVQGLGWETGRIMGLVIGFAVVQLVLLVTSFRSKTYNVNQLVAFVLLFTGFAGIAALVFGPFISDKRYSNALTAVVVCMVLIMIILGFLFQAQVLRFAQGHVELLPGSSEDGPDVRRELQQLESLATIGVIDADDKRWATPSNRLELLQQKYDDGRRWFIGVQSSLELRQMQPFFADNGDAFLFSTGSTDNNLYGLANVFRMLPSNATIIDGMRSILAGREAVTLHVVTGGASDLQYVQDFIKADYGDHVTVVEAVSLGDVPNWRRVGEDADSSVVLVAVPSAMAAMTWTQGGPGDLETWVTDTSMTFPSKEVQSIIAASRAQSLVAQPRALSQFRDIQSLATAEALGLVYEGILRQKEELNSESDMKRFLANQVAVPFTPQRHRRADQLFVVRAIPSGWEPLNGDIVNV